MSIFKESFRDYVKNQLGIRQKIIAQGNSDTNSYSRLLGGNGVAPGAFYSYGSKQCVIRMASLVDLMEDIGLDLGGSRFESYKGETFARNFILEGGIFPTYARNVDGRRVTREVEQVRGGFPKPTKKVNLSYGDPSIASDPSSDGYGVVPMPGIVDANIETKSAYGSLRSAKVNFVCHNLRQLEILELLYMRPGYPVLMEWGWSPYIKNDGTIENSFPSIASEEWFWNDKLVSQEKIQAEVVKTKQSTNGNYDGFIGYVTNFNYTARADGGFDCSTELISMGEVLDSLKVPSFGFSQINKNTFNELDETEKKKIIYQNSLGIVIQDINNTVQPDKAFIENEEVEDVYYSKDGTAVRSDQKEKVENNQQIRSQIQFSKEKLNGILGAEVANESFIYKNQTLSKEGEESISSTQGYIRWDALVTLLNKLVIPQNEKGNPPLLLSTELYRTDVNGNLVVDPILYSKYEDVEDTYMDVSCDAKTCILPHQFSSFSDDNYNLTVKQKIGLAWEGLKLWDFKLIGEVLGAETKSTREPQYPDLQITPEIAKRRIGGIYISVEKLKSIFESTFTNNREATLGTFLENLWKAINQACPMHNFGLRTDPEYNHIIQVIDLPITTDDLKELNYNDLFKFNVLSNDTIAREFKYDTQIPSSLKATIAINAQSGATADDLDSVTFAAFNRSIKSRLHSLEEKFADKNTDTYRRQANTREEKEKRLKELTDIIKEYNEKFFNFIDSNQKDLDTLENQFGAIKSIIKEAQSLEIYLEKSTSGYLKNQSIIPINLNIVLDGISGMVIGNVFRVDESRLPKAYRKGNIAFVALGESQNITSGQDWTTTIRGQMIMFPIEEEAAGKGKFRNKPPGIISPQEQEIAQIIESTEEPNEIQPAESTPTQTFTADELLTKYIDLNRRFFVKIWARDFLQSETFRTGTNVFTSQINQLNSELVPLVDEWEELRPNIEEVFGADYFSNFRSYFRTQWQSKEGELGVKVNINGQIYTPFLEQPRLSPDTANTFLSTPLFRSNDFTITS